MCATEAVGCIFHFSRLRTLKDLFQFLRSFPIDKLKGPIAYWQCIVSSSQSLRQGRADHGKWKAEASSLFLLPLTFLDKFAERVWGVF